MVDSNLKNYIDRITLINTPDPYIGLQEREDGVSIPVEMVDDRFRREPPGIKNFIEEMDRMHNKKIERLNLENSLFAEKIKELQIEIFNLKERMDSIEYYSEEVEDGQD